MADADRVSQPCQQLNDCTSHDGFSLGLTLVASIAEIQRYRDRAFPQRRRPAVCEKMFNAASG